MERAILIEEIKRLKKEKNAVILAHYYVEGDIQDLADFVGDSYYLSKVAKERPEEIIVFCGVTFMGESAKILSSEKTVIVPEVDAICPMAQMVTADHIKEARAKYEDLAVVCYINSSADVKAYADVCVTSSNAKKIVSNLNAKNIFFIPDKNLGKYLSTQIKEKNFVEHFGFCCVHENMDKDKLLEKKAEYPKAKVLAHPECSYDLLEVADFVGSTSEIIDYATDSTDEEFIICTERGVLHPLKAKNPHKKFYLISEDQVCKNMKKITLEKLYDSLKTLSPKVEVSDEVRERASKSLEKMLIMAK